MTTDAPHDCGAEIAAALAQQAEEIAYEFRKQSTPPDALREAAEVVSEQAEDEGLWFIAETAAEAYLQQELRRLHAAIEGEPTLIDALRAAGVTLAPTPPDALRRIEALPVMAHSCDGGVTLPDDARWLDRDAVLAALREGE